MTSGTYQITTYDNVIHDMEDSSELDALVASGDLFITLATDVDSLTESLQLQAGTAAHMKIERLTSTLLYLQRHYRLSRKHSDYRQ